MKKFITAEVLQEHGYQDVSPEGKLLLPSTLCLANGSFPLIEKENFLQFTLVNKIPLTTSVSGGSNSINFRS